MLVRVLSFFLAVALVSSSAWADLPDFTRLIEDNSPAVVKIKATEKAPERRGQRQRIPEGQLPDIFRDFFGDRYGDGGRQYQQPSAMGSGFFISSDGYVLTNHHVIGDADEITVRLSDRREYSAKVVGADPRSDLALLKIDATGLPTVKLATPGDLKVGEWVVAFLWKCTSKRFQHFKIFNNFFSKLFFCRSTSSIHPKPNGRPTCSNYMWQ